MWKESGVSLETFMILYTEVKYQTLLAAGNHTHGLVGTTAEYVRTGLQHLSG